MKSLTLEDCQNSAAAKRGKCLSNVYINSMKQMEWECSNKHIWKTSYGQIRKGTWCAKCAYDNKRIKIEECNNIAVSKNGKCLSENVHTSMDKLLWECSNGHKWEAATSTIKYGIWCGKCHYLNQRTSIEEINGLINHKGRCISMERETVRGKLKFICNNNHEFDSTVDNIKKGRWCPKCKKYKCEDYTRRVLEKLLNKSFPKSHPNWLKNNNGKWLELDGYNEEEMFAFEYNGKQHYEHVKYFGEVERFRKQLENDQCKINKCKENGILLMIVPYKMNNKKKIDDFVCSFLDEYNFSYDRSIISELNI